MGFFKDLQRDSYKLSRLSGDINAAQKNRLAKRLVRRQVTRRLGRSYNKIWRAL